MGAAPHTGRACGAAGLSFLDNQAAQTDQASLASRAMELRRCRGTHLDAPGELHPPGIGRCRPSEAVCVADLAERSAWGLGTGVRAAGPERKTKSALLFSVEKTNGATAIVCKGNISYMEAYAQMGNACTAGESLSRIPYMADIYNGVPPLAMPTERRGIVQIGRTP